MPSTDPFEPAALGLHRSEADAIVETAFQAAEPRQLDYGQAYALVRKDGGHALIDLSTPEHDFRRGLLSFVRKGQPVFHDAEGFGTYVRHHAAPPEQDNSTTTLWADRQAHRITALLDDMGSSRDSVAWGVHRARLQLSPSEAWTAWTGISGKQLPQEEFANFLEDHLTDVVDPPAAQLLEIASTIQATIGANFERGIRLDSGQLRLRYQETIEGRAGAAGDLTIPQTITLGLAPFDGGDPFRVTARFRYRVPRAGGGLTLGVILDQPDLVIREAFDALIAQVTASTEIAVFFGEPPQPLIDPSCA